MKRYRILIVAVWCSFFFVTLKGQAQTTPTDDFPSGTLYFENYKKMSDYVFQNLSNRYPTLSFLKYKRFNEGQNIYDDYKGTLESPSLDALKYLALVQNINLSNCKEDEKINMEYLQKQMIEGATNSVVPLSFTFVEYSDLNPLALYKNYIRFERNQIQDYSPDGFEMFTKNHLFASSPLNQVITSNVVRFKFSEQLILSNIPNQNITNLQVDFGDGIGFVRLLNNDVMQVNYATQGEKEITLKVTYNGTVYYSKSKIIISLSTQNSAASKASAAASIQPPTIGPVPISTTKLGKYVSGRYAVWLSRCNNSKGIRKPYIISAGFNPGGGKQLVPFSVAPMDLTFSLNGQNIVVPVSFSWRGTYYETYNGVYNKDFSPLEYNAYGNSNGNGASNGSRYLDRLRDEGYDIVILMYDNGTDYAINNAALFMELIEQINVQKFSNGSYFENIVSGYSAGGVASKLALSLMESRYKVGKGPNPHTRMWVSVETENQGANVPLGFQHFVNFQANPGMNLPLAPSGLNALQVAADQVNQLIANIAKSFNFNPSANEIMKYNALAGNGMHTDRINLLNTFSSIPLNTTSGYPEFCRRVGVAHGSSIGTQVPHAAPEILDTKLKLNIFGDSYTYSTCDGTYTHYRPVTEKLTTAKWWGAINGSSTVFRGYVAQSTRWTISDRHCWSVWIPFFGTQCVCFPAIEFSGVQVVIGNTNVSKPTAEPNFDDTPSSLQATHRSLYNTSAYPFYNNWFAGNAYARKDNSLHGFVPTVSALDLKNPATGQPVSNFTTPTSLNLMRINPTTNEPNLRYGFPHLSYANPFTVTPYDGVFAIGKNNGTYMDGSPKPGNQFHNEDTQSMMGDYLARIEVAPETLYLSNRTIGTTIVTSFGNYPAEFEARNTILIGKKEDSGVNSIYSKYGNQNYLTPDGDFVVNSKGKMIVHSGTQIEFLPGASIDQGAELSAYISSYICSNELYKRGVVENVLPTYEATTVTNEQAKERKLEPSLVETDLNIQVYPNPSNGNFVIQKNDSKEYTIEIVNEQGTIIKSFKVASESTPINLVNVQKGLYFLHIKGGRKPDIKKLVIE